LKDEDGGATAALKANAIAEAALGFVVVALVGAFGLLAPA
jgi:hypothetical protein